jgi:hypothetical protein
MLTAMDSFKRLSIEDAAHELGLSISTLRRRIRAGSLAVEREQTPQGYRYVVLVSDEPDGSSAPQDGAGRSDGACPTETYEQLAAIVTERDWLRRRVEELTTLLNREQEAVLRLAAGRDGGQLPPARRDGSPANAHGHHLGGWAASDHACNHPCRHHDAATGHGLVRSRREGAQAAEVCGRAQEDETPAPAAHVAHRRRLVCDAPGLERVL